MRLQFDRPIRAVLSAVAGLVLIMQATISSQLVRTADATVRGLRENDFPRVVQLADDVYVYEDLNGDLKGNLAFTTNSLIVITTDGVVTLSGRADSAEQVADAMKIALETEGVREAISTLQVKAAK